MPKGLKETSSPIVVSFKVTESAANTNTEQRIDLQLNALDNEVFVVTGVKLDLESPDFELLTGATRFATFASVSKQSLANATDGTLGNPSVFAAANIVTRTNIEVQPTGDKFGVLSTTQENAVDSPYNVEYLDVVATPDFYVNITGLQQTSAKTVSGKLYGYRARADASTYAALVQSELLSN